MNRTLLLFSFILVSCAVFGQDGDRKAGLDFDIGGAVPTNGSISSLFHFGMSASIGPKIALTKKHDLWLKALGGFKWYYKPSDAGDASGNSNSVTEHFRTWKAGLELQYLVYRLHRLSIEPLVRIDYNWSANYYSQTIGYDPGSNSYQIAKSDNALSGHSLSYDLGGRLRTGRFYIKLDYEYYRPSLAVSHEILTDARTQGLILPASQTFDFSNFNFGVGITF